MKTLLYKVAFLTWWHCGSGQAAGPDVDELAIKDVDGLPFVPGRTMKVLLLDACRQMGDYGFEGMETELVNTVFGHYDEKETGYPMKGEAFFSDMALPANDRRKIAENGELRKAMYSSVTATAIGDDGIAKDQSLRKIQVTVPCALYGTVENVPENAVGMLENAMKFVKRIGLGRNHGLGRCKIEFIEMKES